MNELEIRVNAMAEEYQMIIKSISQRSSELAAANAALRAELIELKKPKTKKEAKGAAT